MILDRNLPKNYQGNIIDKNKPIICAYGETENEFNLFLKIVIRLTQFQFIWLEKKGENIDKVNNYLNIFDVENEKDKLQLLHLSNLLIIFSQSYCQESIILQAIELGLKVVAFSSVGNVREIIQRKGYLLHGKPELEMLLLFVGKLFSDTNYKTNEVKPMDIPNKNNLDKNDKDKLIVEQDKQQDLTKDTKNFLDYKNLGDKLSKEEKFTEAAIAYQQAIGLKPQGANLYYLLAIVQEKQGELDGAIENYRQAIKLNPEDYWTYKLLGDVLRKKERLKEAENAYQKAIELNPSKPNLYYLLAAIQEQQGELEQAINSYEKLIELNPDDYWLYKVLGDIFRQKGNVAKAELLYLQSIERNSAQANLYHLLALVQKQQNKIEAAIESYKKAIKIVTDDEQIANFWHQIGSLQEDCWQLKDAYIAYIKSCCYQEREDRTSKINSLSKDVAQDLTTLSADDQDLELIVSFFESQIDKSGSSEEASFWVYQLLVLGEPYLENNWLEEDGSLGKKIKKLMPAAIAIAEKYNRIDVAIRWIGFIAKYYGNFSHNLQTWLAVNILWYQIKLNKLDQTDLLLLLDTEIKHSQFNLNSTLESFPMLDLEWLKMKGDIQFFKNNLTPVVLTSLVTQYFHLENTTKISPHPIFDLDWYQSKYTQNTDKNLTKTNLTNHYYHPLVDFLRRSAVQPEETNPSAYFDASWYCQKYKLREGEIPVFHYLSNFHQADISPHPFFDCGYLRQILSLPKNIEPLALYIKSALKYGEKWHLGGPNPSPRFQRQFYLESNPEIRKELLSNNQDPFYHFINFGYQENKLAHPWYSYEKFANDHKLYPLESLKTGTSKNFFQNLRGLKGQNAYIDCIRTLGNQLTYQPLISIIMPVYQVKPQFLQEAIDSVKTQSYENWQLCIVDDASLRYRQEILTILRDETQKDSRILYQLRKENGHICRTSNDCLGLATGEFIALLDHDDLLTADALYEVIKALNKNQEIDILYSDEDKIDEWGVLGHPFYKPDWSPHSILSRMYVCHLSVYKTSIIRQVEGFRVGFEGSQDHDLFLRCSEIAKTIHHIPLVLYHWRMHSESTSVPGDTKPYAALAAKKAVEEHLQRRNLIPNVEPIPNLGSMLCSRILLSNRPSIDILIPSRDGADILKVCLESIFVNSSYENFKVTVIDNGSKTSAFKNLVNYWLEKEPKRFSIIPCDIDFNYSLINNIGVSKTEGEYLLLLNNDIEILSPDWLEALLEYAQLSEVGAVGARLLYPDRTIQHGGVIAGMRGIAGHVYPYFPADHGGYYGNLKCVTNYAAVTGACLMVSREKFLVVGGLNEHLKVAFNDVDFCLKLIEKGFYNVYIPHVEIVHHESKTRGAENTKTKQIRFESEILYMLQRWQNFLQNDPFYSPYLTLDREDFSYRFH
jgi:GT2 family glycosyltransferase/Flp pilus assembly protein TadD